MIIDIQSIYTRINYHFQISQYNARADDSLLTALRRKVTQVALCILKFMVNIASFNTCRRPLLDEVSLKNWVREPHDSSEKRQEAAKRILSCSYYLSKNLDLSNLGLTSLPCCIGSLFHLQQLSLRDNRLTALPSTIGNLAQLQQLLLCRNQLKALPGTIGNLAQLHVLDLTYNQLITLPDAIGNLSQLRTLHLSCNQLKALPDTIGNLSQLQELDLIYNQLTALPGTTGNLCELQELNLEHNELTALPNSILGLQESCLVHIEANPFPEAVRTGLREAELTGSGPHFIFSKQKIRYQSSLPSI